MSEISSGDQAKRAQLAAGLDCLTSEELQALAGITPNTEEAWRKRRKGPPYIRFGRVYLYPRVGVAKFLANLVREPRSVPAKALL